MDLENLVVVLERMVQLPFLIDLDLENLALVQQLRVEQRGLCGLMVLLK